MEELTKKALEEYNDDAKAPRRCGTANGKPFWNANSTQFTYAPQLWFPTIPGTVKYVYTATDCNGKEHVFESLDTEASLSPIWGDIPVGFVNLKVEAVHRHLGRNFLSGTRTFFKCAPFPGRENLPERACSYRECALKAFKYVFNDPSTNYWLKHGTPDPEYYHNVYPSKMISSIVNAMISYAELDPENRADALKLATNAADYLLSITYGEDSKLCGVPPTYSFKGLNRETVNKTAPAAEGRQTKVMMIYPAGVGSMYLNLEKATGDAKYFEAAKKIAEFYKKTVLPNGSWHLLIDEPTGTPDTYNCCNNFSLLNFLSNFYKRTGDESFHQLEKNYYNYLISVCLDKYNWEGQFEDITLSCNYENLTHIEADHLVSYIAQNLADDEAAVEEADKLMRFIEDQFVVWGPHAPWNNHYDNGKYWYSPAGLEQYYWYVPIDGSTAMIIKALLSTYSLKKDPIMLEKAKALGDSITRMQDPVSGVIPTHWMKKDCTENLENFWINCHIGTAFQMMGLAKATGEI